MEMITDMWGLSINQTILLIALILIVADFFIPTDIPTFIAHIMLCILLAINIDAHILVKILCALLAWFALLAIHYYVWRVLVQKISDKIIAPDRIKCGAEGTIGNNGVIRDIDGNKMVKVSGDLWPCKGADNLADGIKVTVIAAKNGILDIKE